MMSSIEYKQLALNLKQEETPCCITSGLSLFSMLYISNKRKLQAFEFELRILSTVRCHTTKVIKTFLSPKNVAKILHIYFIQNHYKRKFCPMVINQPCSAVQSI